MPVINKKIAVLGISKVGKTSLIQQLLKGKVSTNYKYVPTVQDCYHHAMCWNGEMCNLDITDTSGNNDFPAMKNLSIDTADGFILVYQAERMESVRELERIYKLVKERGKEEVPCVIVRNQFRNLHDKATDVQSANNSNGSLEETRKKCCDVISVYLTTRRCRHVEISQEVVESAHKVFEELLLLFYLPKMKLNDIETDSLTLLGKTSIRTGCTADKDKCTTLLNPALLKIQKARKRTKSM